MKQFARYKLSKMLLGIVVLLLAFGPISTLVSPEFAHAATALASDVQKIGDIRTQPDKAVVTTTGIVTADPAAISNGSQLSTFIQDETGGINLFAFKKSDFPTLKKGDLVKVNGSLRSYHGLKELVPSKIEILQHGQALPAPKAITLKDLQTAATAEQYEGQLVHVTGYIKQIPATPAGGGYNASFIDKDYNGTTLRIMEKAVDISTIEADKWYDITAIVGQYDSYQLIPTEAADFQLAKEQPELPSPKGIYEGTVSRITDGDTIVLENPVLGATRVRFLNMDTPETYTPRNKDTSRTALNESQKKHGDAATAYIKELIQVGDKVNLKVGEEATDGYGRLLAEVIRLDGLNLNLEMVKQGYAVTYFIAPIDEASYPIYQQAVKDAKNAGLGIWNPADPLKELPFVFRVHDDGRDFDKFVGNSDTKQLVNPQDWEQVPVEKRVFFWDEAQANQAGYAFPSSITNSQQNQPAANPETQTAA